MGIGNPKLPGSACYDQATRTYSLSGAEANIWFNKDQFHFPDIKIKGDFILTADFAFPSVLTTLILWLALKFGMCALTYR